MSLVSSLIGQSKYHYYAVLTIINKKEASADRTARRQFQAATGQPVSRTQASDAMTSRLPRYEAKYVQRKCFQCGSVPLRSDIKGTELPPANILIPLERQLTALQLCCWQFLYNETLQQTFHPLLSKLVWKTTNLGHLSPFWGSYEWCRTLVDGSLESPCRVLVKFKRLRRYKPKCTKTRCLQEGVGHSEPTFQREGVVPLPIYWYHSKGNWLRYNSAAEILYNETFQQTFRPVLSKLSKRRQI